MPAHKKIKQIASKNLFPVIGVGASAGGLDAFKDLVKAIPKDSGMAYILIQHLAPQHESFLPDIIQQSTDLPVSKITNHIKIAPDHIYIIPSDKILIANDGVLLLEPLNRKDRLHTIDTFFASLAEIHREHAIGVVLSGTGSDGTIGLKMIKDQGGVTMAQDAGSAAHYGMPQSAIDAAVVDFVLPPAHIPQQLQELVRATKIMADPAVSEEMKEEEVFKQILTLLRVKRGLDLSFYKQTTIRRRIIRRKLLNKLSTLKEYQDYLFENKTEQDDLFKDVLIPVTAFFRDPELYAFLTEKVFPVLFEHKPDAEVVRIWIAGCSTGEEAYSMAICLHEYFRSSASPRKIQVFASDISDTVIAKARRGVYDKKDMAGVSEERRKEFFAKTDGSYQVNKAIREVCVFATQNFLKDPPFARMDIISCRNVLIYMEPYLQKKAFSAFHYALNPDGFLVLGKSETAGQSPELFQNFSQHEKVYTRKAFAGKSMQVTSQGGEAILKRKDTQGRNEGRKNDYQKAADEALLQKWAVVGVVVNEQFNIVQFRGATGAYLESPPGKATHQVLKMAREGLAFELRTALHKAKQNNESVRTEGITLDQDKRKVDIEIIPLQHTIEQCFLILFAETPDPADVLQKRKNKRKGVEEEKSNQERIRIEELEKELARLHYDMRAITEDQDAANEELQSANEDLLASSEELQSLNEELETSKEEIQSSNEELTILNQELFERNEQLTDARRYAEAIVATIHEPLVILTKDLRVRSANKAFYDKFRLTEQQTEVSLLFELGSKEWDIPVLHERLNRALSDQLYFDGLEVTVSFSGAGERVMMLNARQLVHNNHTDEQLILLAVEDITERKTLERNQRLFAHELEQKVVERTRELKEANVQLQQSNENLQQFASSASHDLQEPLRKITTFASLLTKRFSGNLPEAGKEVIGKINLSADRMSQLIREVLEYSKLTRTGRDYVPTDLDAVLKNVLGDLDLLLSDTGALIGYPKPLPVIDAMPLQMNQLFYNILTNALKFRKPAIPPEIFISFRTLPAEEVKKISQLQEGEEYVEIVFSDNGIGFEQQFAEQIFQLFERLYSPDEYEGTGVGLALCRKVVENHHGYIFALSKQDEGAAFHLMLPVKQT